MVRWFRVDAVKYAPACYIVPAYTQREALEAVGIVGAVGRVSPLDWVGVANLLGCDIPPNTAPTACAEGNLTYSQGRFTVILVANRIRGG